MKKARIIMIVTVSLIAPVVLWFAAARPYQVAMYFDAMTNVANVELYGKVTDENGRALPSAVVRYRLVKPNWRFLFDGELYRQPTMTVSTDIDGRFRIADPRGVTIYIDTISREGYSFSKGRNEGIYYFAGPGANQPAPRADPSNPQMFRLKASPGGQK
jgi:hypothetical protein